LEDHHDKVFADIKQRTASVILECLCEEIAAANTHETPPSAAAHLHLKGQAQNGAFLHTLKK